MTLILVTDKVNYFGKLIDQNMEASQKSTGFQIQNNFIQKIILSFSLLKIIANFRVRKRNAHGVQFILILKKHLVSEFPLIRKQWPFGELLIHSLNVLDLPLLFYNIHVFCRLSIFIICCTSPCHVNHLEFLENRMFEKTPRMLHQLKSK